MYIYTYVCSTHTVCIYHTRSIILYVPIFLDAARRFYQSILETNALKDKGKYDFKVTQQRRKNRICRVRFSFVLPGGIYYVHVPFFTVSNTTFISLRNWNLEKVH